MTSPRDHLTRPLTAEELDGIAEYYRAPIDPMVGVGIGVLERLIAMARRLLEQEWRPIESALVGRESPSKIAWLRQEAGEWVAGGVAEWCGDFWWDNDLDQEVHPTHWMPLPAPPKETGHE